MERLLIGAAVLALVGCEAKEAGEAEAPAPRWTHVSFDQGVHFFVTRPIGPEQRRRIWTASFHTTESETKNYEAHLLYEVNCEEQSARRLAEAGYDAESKPIDLQPGDRSVSYPSPDSHLHDVVEMACGRQPITGPGFDTIKQAKASETLKEIEAEAKGG